MRIRKLIISIIALLNVLFVPIFDVWGGLFPGHPDDNFMDVVEYVFDGDSNIWVVVFTLSIFVPSLLMLIFSFTEKSGMFKVSSGLGVGLLVFDLIHFVSQNEWSDLFDFDDCSVSIGMWLGLAIFIAALIFVKKPKQEQFIPNQKYIAGLNDDIETVNVTVKSNETMNQHKRFCHNCGAEITTVSAFCGNCGTKM